MADLSVKKVGNACQAGKFEHCRHGVGAQNAVGFGRRAECLGDVSANNWIEQTKIAQTGLNFQGGGPVFRQIQVADGRIAPAVNELLECGHRFLRMMNDER